MPAPLSRNKDRRQLNVNVPEERRKGSGERRRCPECSTTLKASVRRLAGGTVTVLECGHCGWTRSSRQTDAAVLMLKLTWGLELKAQGGQLAAQIPPELADALKIRQGDELVISPLTSAVGSLPMKWALTVKRKKR